MNKTILVSGGAGYVGSVLVPQLVKKGFTVHVFDTFWYWDNPDAYAKALNLSHNPALKLFKGDLRNLLDIRQALKGVDTVIQLACISNDPSSDLDPAFTHSINYDGNVNIIDESKRAGVKRFIYASSSSVYGIKEVPDVTEDQLLEPLTQYSKLKVEIEHYLLHVLDDNFKGMIVRPSTVCGYSPRQRLDVVVNIFVDFAVNRGKIKIFGGDQLRPNIHIQDMADLYVLLTEIDIDKINGKIYNAGWENLKVTEIAYLVKEVIGNVELEVVPTDDNRSYHVSSKKIKEEIGFSVKHTVKDAILDLKNAFAQNKIVNSQDDKYHNIRRMKKILGI
jgi:nucleoside-diphosphate-sugar epimerase